MSSQGYGGFETPDQSQPTQANSVPESNPVAIAPREAVVPAPATPLRVTWASDLLSVMQTGEYALAQSEVQKSNKKRKLPRSTSNHQLPVGTDERPLKKRRKASDRNERARKNSNAMAKSSLSTNGDTSRDLQTGSESHEKRNSGEGNGKVNDHGLVVEQVQDNLSNNTGTGHPLSKRKHCLSDTESSPPEKVHKRRRTDKYSDSVLNMPYKADSAINMSSKTPARSYAALNAATGSSSSEMHKTVSQNKDSTALGAFHDPSIFRPNGNRKREYRCTPCIEHKKGCKGHGPVCDTCKRYKREHLCNLSDLPKPDGGNKNDSDQPSFSDSRQNPVQDQGHDFCNAGLEDPVANAMDPTNPEILCVYTKSPTPPDMDHRTNSQKRTVHVLDPADIQKIDDEVVKAFIEKYNAPFSRNLLPMVEEIVASIDNNANSTPEQLQETVSKKSKLEAAKKRFDRIWDLVLCHYPEEEYSTNMTASQKISWLRKGSPKPTSEREVEEFFLAYMCVSGNDWEEQDIENTQASYWYSIYVDSNWNFLRESLFWHEISGLGWEQKKNWVQEWLNKKAQAEAVVVAQLAAVEEA